MQAKSTNRGVGEPGVTCPPCCLALGFYFSLLGTLTPTRSLSRAEQPIPRMPGTCNYTRGPWTIFERFPVEAQGPYPTATPRRQVQSNFPARVVNETLGAVHAFAYLPEPSGRPYWPRYSLIPLVPGWRPFLIPVSCRKSLLG